MVAMNSTAVADSTVGAGSTADAAKFALGENGWQLGAASRSCLWSGLSGLDFSDWSRPTRVETFRLKIYPGA
jgi:hypothetical protein